LFAKRCTKIFSEKALDPTFFQNVFTNISGKMLINIFENVPTVFGKKTYIRPAGSAPAGARGRGAGGWRA
jgi:hypothetical protein